ncbi:MAG: hypothetical protein M1541_11410 [Acidobacteria bacterium]|nr:hypothetical protein [Acidobacteriota bacterium]
MQTAGTGSVLGKLKKFRMVDQKLLGPWRGGSEVLRKSDGEANPMEPVGNL